MLPELAAAFTLVGVTAYVVLGGADFGAGFWDLTAGGAERGAPVRAMIKRSMSPVWEANHVWLIFVLVMLWTAFPEAFGSITSTLAIPLFLAGLGIVLRGAYTVARNWTINATYFMNDLSNDVPQSVTVFNEATPAPYDTQVITGVNDRDYKRLQLDLNFRF